MINQYIKTNEDGHFLLSGEPWFMHATTYFGRKPGTCGADWLGENFEYNKQFIEQDICSMQKLKINTIALFIPKLFKGMSPDQDKFDQVSYLLDQFGRAGIRVLMLDLRYFDKEDWCRYYGVDPNSIVWKARCSGTIIRAGC